MDRNAPARNSERNKTQSPPDPPSHRAGEAFWRFSLALYARPDVAEALIGLQDRAGLDVDLILEQQLAFLEALHLQLIERAVLDDARDHVVEVAMLGPQSGKPGFEGFDVEIHRALAPFGASGLVLLPLRSI